MSSRQILRTFPTIELARQHVAELEHRQQRGRNRGEYRGPREAYFITHTYYGSFDVEVYT